MASRVHDTPEADGGVSADRAPSTRRNFLVAAGALSLTPTLLARWPSLAPRHVPRHTFDPPIGVCRGPGDAEAAEAAGAAYLEISCAGELRPMDADVGDRLERLLALPIPPRRANGFLPRELKATGPDADHDAVLAYAGVAFERASSVGLTAITFGSAGSRTLPPGFDPGDARLQFTALLARMAPLAHRHGVVVCVENLQKRETNFLNRVAEITPIVRAIDHPGVRITADVYHMLVEDESPDAIREAGDLVHHVHIAEERGRRAPGTSGEDLTPYLAALRDVGYEGLISIECGWGDFAADAPAGIASLREQITSVA